MLFKSEALIKGGTSLPPSLPHSLQLLSVCLFLYVKAPYASFPLTSPCEPPTPPKALYRTGKVLLQISRLTARTRISAMQRGRACAQRPPAHLAMLIRWCGQAGWSAIQSGETVAGPEGCTCPFSGNRWAAARPGNRPLRACKASTRL